MLEKLCKEILKSNFTPVSVRTQAHCGTGSADISIHLVPDTGTSGDDRLVIESKIGAPLHDRQLECYLDTGCYVALFSKRPQNVPLEVLDPEQYPKYMKPKDERRYFSWAEDLYSIIPDSAEESVLGKLRVAFKAYMRRFRLSPPPAPDPGLNWLLSLDEADREKQKVQFGDPLKNLLTRPLAKLGFRKPTGVSKNAVEAKPVNTQPFLLLNAGPTAFPPIDYLRRGIKELENCPVLIVSVRYEKDRARDHVNKLSEEFPQPYVDNSQHRWFATRPYEMTTGRMRVDFVANLNLFLMAGKVDLETISASCVNVIEEILSLSDRLK